MGLSYNAALGMDRQLLDSPIYRGRKLRKSISLLCFPKFLSEACSADVRIILQIEHRPARLSQDTCALLLRGFQSGFQLADSCFLLGQLTLLIQKNLLFLQIGVFGDKLLVEQATVVSCQLT
ncbi:hypothetical protein D3C79_700430 [compost metagenome]